MDLVECLLIGGRLADHLNLWTIVLKEAGQVFAVGGFIIDDKGADFHRLGICIGRLKITVVPEESLLSAVS